MPALSLKHEQEEHFAERSTEVVAAAHSSAHASQSKTKTKTNPAQKIRMKIVCNVMVAVAVVVAFSVRLTSSYSGCASWVSCTIVLLQS